MIRSQLEPDMAIHKEHFDHAKRSRAAQLSHVLIQKHNIMIASNTKTSFTILFVFHLKMLFIFWRELFDLWPQDDLKAKKDFLFKLKTFQIFHSTFLNYHNWHEFYLTSVKSAHNSIFLCVQSEFFWQVRSI